MEEIVVVEGLKKRFGANVVLDGVDIAFPEKKITSIIGQSGSGKSVLIKHVIGIMKPDAGTVYYRGEDIFRATKHRQRQIRHKFAYLFQNSALFDSLTVEQNIAFPLIESLGIKDKDVIKRTVSEKLEWVGLPEVGKVFPSELSGGMRKRIGLARTLAMQPEVLLFDEPTTGLDPVLAESINDLIINVNREFAITCVLITHDIQATFRISDYIGFLYDGQIKAKGTPSEVVRSDHPVLQRFISNSFNELEV
ncbi:MAG: ATP-binding cassette domain-containing protein [Alkalispirochaeta sp.]|jgi:phospholipid/cholesterol/gamma-HCH transport system ATP-binding protein